MNISNLLLMRSEFFSEVESLHAEDEFMPFDTFLCASDSLGPNSTDYYGITVSSTNLKQFLSYLVGIHQREPLFSGSNILLNVNGHINPNQSVYFEEFNQLTTVNSKETFKFKPIEATDSFSIGFYNTSYQGESDEYVPFGYSNAQAIDSKLSATRQQVKDFFQLNYRSKFLRGNATFDLAKAYNKNHVIELIDKNVYLVIAGIQYNDDGVHSYEAIVLARR